MSPVLPPIDWRHAAGSTFERRTEHESRFLGR
jgi:hypothetical protein